MKTRNILSTLGLALGATAFAQAQTGTGDKPSVRKMVITYKQLPGEPQYTLQLLKMETVSKIKDAVFACEIPKGTEKIEIQPVTKAKEQTK